MFRYSPNEKQMKRSEKKKEKKKQVGVSQIHHGHYVRVLNKNYKMIRQPS